MDDRGREFQTHHIEQGTDMFHALEQSLKRLRVALPDEELDRIVSMRTSVSPYIDLYGNRTENRWHVWVDGIMEPRPKEG